MLRRELWILALALGPNLACRSAEPELYDIYRGALEELADAHGMSDEARSQNARRYKRVRKRIAAGGVVSAQDHLYAAGALSTSDEMKDLELARNLAAKAAELGEALGNILVAETTDKILVQQGQRQKYGTQVYLDLPTQLWHLYPADPLTSDADRASMGLPPLAEMLRLLTLRNDQSEIASAVSEAIGRRPDGAQ